MKNDMKESNNLPVGCQKMLIAFLIVVVIFMIMSKLFHSNVHNAYNIYSNRTTNDTLIRVYTDEFYRDKRFKAIASVMSKIEYDGELQYIFYSTPGNRHKLMGPYGCLNDSFPWVANEMKKISGDKCWGYDVTKDKNMVILPTFSYPRENLYGMFPHFLYTTQTEQNIVLDHESYENYIVCDTISNDYKGGWILRLEKNWYLVSPDTSHTKTIILLDL